MNWTYNNKERNTLEDMPEGCYGFWYRIANTLDNTFYIGKKQLKSIQNKRLGKKEIKNLPTTRGRNPTKKKVITESDWINYWSSSKVLKEHLKQLGKDKFKREIIAFAFNSKQLSYLETKYQFVHNVLEDEKSLNDNISGRYFKENIK